MKPLRGRVLLFRAQLAGRRQTRAMARGLARQREKAARDRQANDRMFGTALQTMSQGLCMFDDAGSLLVANARLATLLGLPADALRPGLQLREVVQVAVRHGVFPTRSAEAIGLLLHRLNTRRRARDGRIQLLDGRTIAFSFRPMNESPGDESPGWVVSCEDVTERRRSEQRILHMAQHDMLTNLPNRALLHDRLEAAMAQARRGGGLSLLYLDLVGFKVVNDTLGHLVGDALLRAVAARLLTCVRQTDTLARVGGDEFMLLQLDGPLPEDAACLADRLIAEFASPFEVEGHAVDIGVSIGISVAPRDADDPEQLLRNADLALHRAKVDGGGSRFFEPEMDVGRRKRLELEADLRQAVLHNEFVVYYQPVVELRSMAVRGFEALVRWQHPRRGLVAPGAFIGVAEETGLITAIGEQVLKQACRDAATWPNPVRVAVNLSCHQVSKGPALIAVVAAALDASGLPAHRLELEITESVLLQDTEDTLATLRQLKGLGVKVSMDDFGTGYSSLSYLQKFPFDKVKIDQSFVRGLGQRRDCSAIVHAISGLCASLEIATVAEGVETEQQLACLVDERCQEVQGYLFSTPRPSCEVPAMLKQAGRVPLAVAG